EPILLPDTLHTGMADTRFFSHCAHAPVRSAGRAFLDGLLDDRALDGLGDRLLAGRFAPSFDQPGDASFDKILLPSPNRRLGYANRAHDSRYTCAVGRHEHNLRPFCDLLGDVAVPDQLLKLSAILRAECEFRLLRIHAATESYSQQFWIHMFV